MCSLVPDATNEGNEFYVGFFRNRFGRTSEQEVIDPVVCIMTREQEGLVLMSLAFTDKFR